MRIRVVVKWDPQNERFAPYNDDGELVRPHSGLCYGDTPVARAGKGDDPNEARKTIDYTKHPPMPAIDAVLIGWTDDLEPEPA